MKLAGILVVWALLALQQNANAGDIREGNGDTFKLIGVSKPRVTIGDNAIVRAGSTVEIKCPVNVSPELNPAIEWELDGSPLEFDGFNAREYPNIRRYTEMSLTIYNISESNAGTYTCVLTYSSDNGILTQRADTIIQVAPDCPGGCQGEPGAKGYPGSRGQEGSMGRSGLPGICYPEECPQPDAGAKGEKGASGAKGVDGSSGEKGVVGDPGDNGETGTIGDTGSRGANGDQGVKGNQGEQGPSGERGLQGDRGEEGVSGDRGQDGMKGIQGDQGPKGDGPSGDTGDKGSNGDVGDVGQVGDEGAKGRKGGPGDKGDIGETGNQGTTGGVGDKGPLGMRIIILDLNSTNNPDCRGYDLGQIVYDTVLDRFVYCDGNTFQCIRDKPCFDVCDPNQEATLTQTPEEAAKCVNLIYAIDESASMGPEHIWLANVSAAIPGFLQESGFVAPDICTNYFGIVRFGADIRTGEDNIGRPLDLGGIEVDGVTLPLWGRTEALVANVDPSQFLAAGRLEDGYAAIYRALQRYIFVQPACRKIVLITDEDRDNLTPTPDPIETRIPTLLNQNMLQTLNSFSIVLSAIVNLTIEVDASYGIPKENILAILPGNVIVYIEGGVLKDQTITGEIQLGIPDGTERTQNTIETYYQMVKGTGGILWSLPVSRAFRDIFTRAFFEYEVIPNVPFVNQPAPKACTVIGCQECPCIDDEIKCSPLKTIDFDTTLQCRPIECNMTQIISGFRQPSCVDVVFAVAETQQMDSVHDNIKDVAGGLLQNLAAINFGQENSICQNNYCLMTFGDNNDRVQDSCYARSFGPSAQQLCGVSSEIAGLIIPFEFEDTGSASDGYAAIYSALRRYPAEFQDQSCRHITLITNGPRSDCGSFTDDDLFVPELNFDDIARELEQETVFLNVIVAAEFEDGEGNEALGIFQDTDGSVKAVVVSSDSSGFVERDGGRVKPGSALFNIDSAYIMLALKRGGSAWDIVRMGTQTNEFTKAFVGVIVVRSSLACGETRACVECRCVSGILEPCRDSSVCIFGEPPELRYTSGSITITTDNVLVDVGGFGDTESKVYYGLDGDLLTRFAIGSSLLSGTQPVNSAWYYVGPNGENIPIEQSAVASYVSVSTTNPYNLEFSQVGDQIQGSYVLIAENEHGTDTQYTNIGILPKWDKSASGTVTGTQAQLGQTLVTRTGSEVRIDGIVREGTREWSFQWFYGGVELVEGVDYSFEYVGNSASIIIHNFQAQGEGEYTAIVRNMYGEDTHTFNLLVQTVVSCDNNPENTDTACASCSPDRLTEQATLTIYAHSFSQNQQLSWIRRSKNGGQRETLATQNIVSGANRFVIPISDICSYDYEVVAIGQNTYTFTCPCEDCTEREGDQSLTVTCCGDSLRLLTQSDCGGDFFADIIITVDVSASMDTEHAFLRAFLPRFEESLRENCVGNSSINRNQYTVVAFGSIGDKENPYFVGPGLERGDSTQNVFFTIDPNDDSNVTRTIGHLPTVGEREDGYAAINFAVKFAQLRDNSLRFAILVTDEYRDFFYSTREEVTASNTLFNDFTDYGRSLYVSLFRDNNIIPIQIIDVTLTSGNTQCLGVSSAETCFYRLPGSLNIETIENAQVINTASNAALVSVHTDYLQTALDAGGYVWDLKVIRRNETGNWDAITEALTDEALTRAREELTQCRDCFCLPGGRQCQIVPEAEQAACKCEKAFPGNTAYCNCFVNAETTVQANTCRCRFINGLSESACQLFGQVQLVHA